MAIPIILLAGCEDRRAPSPEPSFVHDPANGETPARVATTRGAVEMQTGATVPLSLPPGLTIYPGAHVAANTVVVRGAARHTLVEFETPDPLAKVMLFHRAQAEAAGVLLTLDLDGTEAASIGGRTVAGGDYALTARRSPGLTMVQLAVSDAIGSGQP